MFYSIFIQWNPFLWFVRVYNSVKFMTHTIQIIIHIALETAVIFMTLANCVTEFIHFFYHNLVSRKCIKPFPWTRLANRRSCCIIHGFVVRCCILHCSVVICWCCTIHCFVVFEINLNIKIRLFMIRGLKIKINYLNVAQPSKLAILE